MDKTKILIIEDESIIGMDISHKLEVMGYAVAGMADTAEGAIEMIRKDKPDLILMDIVLKDDSDGIKAAEEIFGKYNLPVIFITAYSDEQTIQRAKISEPYGYIIKPFKERELRVIIEIALYKHKMDQELMEKKSQLEELNRSLEEKVRARTRELQDEIDEREKVEKLLRQNEEIFREMAEFLPVILVEYDRNFNLTYVNQAGYEAFGYTPGDLKKGIHVFDVSQPDEKERIVENCGRIFQGERSPLRHYKFLRKDRSIVNSIVNSSAIYRNGSICGARSVIIDIKPYFFSSILPDNAFFKEYSFTQREKEILTCLAQGRKNKEISGSLNISENTLKTHMSNIYDKMGAASREEIFDIIKEFQINYIGRDRLFLAILSMLVEDGK